MTSHDLPCELGATAPYPRYTPYLCPRYTPLPSLPPSTLGEFEAAFAQYDAGLRLDHHPRISSWLEAERRKPQYLTDAAHAGPRAVVSKLAAAVRANDVRRLALVLGRCPAQVLPPPYPCYRPLTLATAPYPC